jgi:CRISPR-associated protein Cmr5
MLTKDQLRASRAYSHVGELKAKKDREDYQIAVKALGANILRSGLSAALADLMRRKGEAKKLRQHLAASEIPGLADVAEQNLFKQVNALDVGTYMLATRETLQVVMWLKRACDALDSPEEAAATAAGPNGDGHA